MSRSAFIYSLTAFFRHFPSESGTGTIFLLCRSVATNAKNFIEAKTSSFSAEAKAVYVTVVFA